MLKTNSRTEYGIMVSKSGNNPPINNVAISRTLDFTVDPSPCVNTGNHKLPNAYSFVKTDRWEPNGFIKSATYYGYISSYTGYLGGMVGATPTIVMDDESNTIRNRALAKLYKAIRDSEVSLNTTIGESRETHRMMMAVAHSAALVVDNLKKAKRKASRAMLGALKNPLQTVGGFELLWAVGIKPLLMDVENLRNHVANKREPYVDIPVDARASSSHDKVKVTNSGGTRKEENRTLSQRVEYGLVFQISDVHSFENWRLGLTVRPTLLWELTTLSFVIDYFVNIGEFLELYEASVANNGVSFKSGFWTTSTRDQWWIESSKPYVYQEWIGGEGFNWHLRGETSTKHRVVLRSFPKPAYPTVKLPSAASPLLNCAALLSQLIQRK